MMTESASRDLSEPDGEFVSKGWSLLSGFIDHQERAALASAVSETLTAPGPSCMNRPGNDLVSLRWCDPIVRLFLGSREGMDRLRNSLGARDLKWISAYISSKPPLSSALWWHQDWWCWDHPVSFRPASPQVAVLCYLSDTGEENGALRVLPGTHHRSVPLHAVLPEPHGLEADALPADHPAMADQPDQVTIPVRAGDAVVLDYRLLHGTHANGSGQRRDCVLLSFLPDWAGLPAELKAHLIMHPALPEPGELAAAPELAEPDLLPSSTEPPASLRVNRRAPARFAAAGTDSVAYSGETPTDGT